MPPSEPLVAPASVPPAEPHAVPPGRLLAPPARGSCERLARPPGVGQLEETQAKVVMRIGGKGRELKMMKKMVRSIDRDKEERKGNGRR